MGYKHALGMIGRNGGEELEDAVRIKVEEPVAVKYEKAFEGLFPVKSMNVPWENRSLLSDGTKEYSFDFSGKGFVLNGGAGKLPGVSRDVDLHIDVYVDGSLWEEAVIPTSFQARRHELTWKYNLEEGNHTVKVVWKDPAEGYKIDLDRVIVYGPEPVI
jgi:hypothetical protein